MLSGVASLLLVSSVGWRVGFVEPNVSMFVQLLNPDRINAGAGSNRTNLSQVKTVPIMELIGYHGCCHVTRHKKYQNE